MIKHNDTTKFDQMDKDQVMTEYLKTSLLLGKNNDLTQDIKEYYEERFDCKLGGLFTIKDNI